MDHRQRAPRHDQATIRGAREGRDGTLDLARVANVERTHLHPERRRHGLDGAELADAGGDGRIANDCRSGHFRCDFFEQLKPFPAQAVLELAKSGNNATRPSEASDEARADRINNQYKHDRQGAGGLKQRWQNGGASGQNNIRRERHQFRNVTWIARRIAAAPAIVDLQVASYLPPQVPKFLKERSVAGLSLRVVRRYRGEHADPPHPLGLLRARRERPRSRRAAEQRDELAPVHSITSSARSKNVSGIARPSALTVVRLMTSSNLVGCSTGRSAGLVPLRILSTKSAACRN